MVKTASELGFDALAKLAKAATDDVVAISMRDKTELPVWLNGEVVYKLVIKLQDAEGDEICTASDSGVQRLLGRGM